jgi:hypothetical protein
MKLGMNANARVETEIPERATEILAGWWVIGKQFQDIFEA